VNHSRLVRMAPLGLLVVAACDSNPVTAPILRCTPGATTALTLAIGDYVAVDPSVTSGCITFPANAAPDTTEYLLVAQSASGKTGTRTSFRLAGSSAPLSTVASASLAPPEGPPPVPQAFDLFLRGLERTRAYTIPPSAPGSAVGAASVPRAAAMPPAVGDLRRFTVCATLACSSYSTVWARAEGVGGHIAIYVDTLAPPGGLNGADLDTLTTLFDGRLYPIDTTTFGRESDVDSNKVVIVLMTGVVNSLVTAAQCNTSGYVAGFFFSADLDPTLRSQFNNGEVFYSIVADSAGTLSCAHSRASVKRILPPTFVHEFQHMINFAQHVLVRGAPPEEGWLDEGLSKYAEEMAGRSYLPDDSASFNRYANQDLYDAYQYLTDPGASALLIPQDNGTLAEIGASWLFVRYLIDHYGASLPRQLAQSSRIGSANVAAATGEPFTTLVTRWAMANWVSDLPGFTAPPELTYTSWQFRSAFALLNAQDPVHYPFPYPLVPPAGDGGGVNGSGTLFSGSGEYYRALQGPGAPGFAVLFSTADTTALSTVVVPRLDVIRIR
jgi:hypothetical protein